MIFFCREQTLRDLIKQIFALIDLVIKSLWALVVWTWNRILDTPTSTYWKIFWWVLAAMAVIGLLGMAYEKIKGLRGQEPASKEEGEEEPQPSETTEHTCWKCKESIPVEEYYTHIKECLMQDGN